MTSTKDNYFLELDRVNLIFENVLNEIFTNPCSREETALHSFYIKRSDSSESIYFDGKLIPEEEIGNREHIGDQSFIRDYLIKKAGRKEHLINKAYIIRMNGSRYKLYWTLSSECLDEHHGTLILNCLLRQSANKFNELIFDPPESYCKPFIHAAEIIRSVEKDIEGYLQGMFEPFKIDLVNILSGEYYEKSECQSNIIFLPYGVAESLVQEDWLYRFEEIPFHPAKSRLVRKLLQMTRDKLYLVLGADEQRQLYYIHGICNIDKLEKKLPKTGKSMFPYLKVEIQKHMLWKLLLNRQYIFTSQNGHFKIEREIQKNYLRSKLTDYFGQKEDDYDELIKNITQLAKQDHGTMLIIMEPAAAKQEATRLGNLKYGFAESHPKPQTEVIKYLSSIDGGIIIDTKGKVHGIGVILDGLSSKGGSSERGARYNSVKKYPDALSRLYPDEPLKGLAVVISDDGFVDILPV